MTKDHPPGTSDQLHDRRDFLRKSALGAGAIAGSGLFAASAAGGRRIASAQKHNVIAFSHPYSDVPVVGYVQGFAKERGKQLGYKVLVDNSHAKLDLQVAAIESWISQKVDAIVALPMEPSTLEQLAKKARKRGILFYAYSDNIKNQDGAVLFSHSVSGNLLGAYAANWINRTLGGKAEVAIFTLSTLSFGHLRTDPLEKWLKRTKATIVAKQDAVDPATGLQVTEDILQAHPNLSVVLGINDDGALGAYQAFQNAGKDPKRTFIGGQDGTKDGIAAVLEKKHYKASAAVRLRDIGYAVVDLPAQALEGGAKASANIPPILIRAGREVIARQYLSDYK